LEGKLVVLNRNFLNGFLLLGGEQEEGLYVVLKPLHYSKFKSLLERGFRGVSI
jgi:hypothetical protein